MSKYADIMLLKKSNATDSFYTYESPFDDIKVGDKVEIPFGKSLTAIDGYVVSTSEKTDGTNYRKIISIDKKHSLTPEIIEVIKWMRERYFIRYSDAAICFSAGAGKLPKNKIEVPDNFTEAQNFEQIKLSSEQQKAYNKIEKSIEEKRYKTFLLHGITGSGKTEIYIKAVQKVLSENADKVAIILVPEISLTMQTVDRFKKHLEGIGISVLHSKMSKGARYKEWLKIKSGQNRVVIGARSAIFAPASKIGIVIVDEEHESSYKSDMTPKYDGIEVAIKRAFINNAPVILGSATPSVVSYYRAKQGYYSLLELKQRYNNVMLPSSKIIDMKQEIEKGNMSVFSTELKSEILKAKSENKQTILFLNRRGFAPSVTCQACGTTLKCEDCDITLTYHKSKNALVCHFCGRVYPVPTFCPFCGKQSLNLIGIGTEKLEEITKKEFPSLSISRIDLDTIQKKGELKKRLTSFAKGETDILIGTQIIAKGLDFDNVKIVGIVLADIGLSLPDFRSTERSFSLITQVSGRAGRRDTRGKVFIQTYKPDNYSILCAKDANYLAFFNEEITFRLNLNYPPFSDFVQILISSSDEISAEDGANSFATEIGKIFSENNLDVQIIGPTEAPVAKLSGKFRYMIYLKIKPESAKPAYSALGKLRNEINLDTKKKYLIGLDINPYSFM